MCVNIYIYIYIYTYIFDTRYQRDQIGAQVVQLNFEFALAVSDIVCHALVLIRKISSVNREVL